MKKFYAVNGFSRTSFANEAKLDAFLADHPNQERVVNHEWASDELRINIGNTQGIITSEDGIQYPLEAAIERNWDNILRGARMFGLSGYKLESAHIRRNDNKCVITLKGWNTSAGLVGFDAAKHWADDKLLTREVVFTGVEDGDLHADEFDVELK